MKFEKFFKVQVLDKHSLPVGVTSPLHENEGEAHEWAEENHSKIITGNYTVIPVMGEVKESEKSEEESGDD